MGSTNSNIFRQFFCWLCVFCWLCFQQVNFYFFSKKLTLDNNEPLSFWTDEYKMELENYLMQFFGEKIEVNLLKTEPTENTEPTEKLSEDIAVSTAQEIFKV